MSPVAIVTGAARGIGRAVVARLAEDGWRVVAVDVCADDPALDYPLATRADLDRVVAMAPDRIQPVVADVRDRAALGEAVRLATRLGGPDAVVGCAAVIAGGKPLWLTEDREWDALFDVDVRGIANLARAAVPAMLDRARPGRFIAIASAAAHHSLWNLSAYTAAKLAVVGLIRGLANDLRGTGITATAVSPGSTATAMLTETARLYGLDTPEPFAEHQLLQRLLDPAEIAAIIAWLCGPGSAPITGSVVHADAGFIG